MRSGSSWSYAWCSPAFSGGAKHRFILELGPLPGGLKKKRPAAHVSPSHEISREEQPLAQRLQQDVHVLAGGDAAEEHNLDPFQITQQGDVTLQRPAVTRVVDLDVHLSEPFELRNRDARVGGKQSAVCGD